MHPDETLRARLDALVASQDARARLAEDPVSFVHRYASPEDREIVGLLASHLAFGNVKAIRAKVARALDVLGESPSGAARSWGEARLRRRLDGFAHRVWKGPDVARLLARAGRAQGDHGSLGAAMHAHLDATGGDLREALARLADALRGPDPSRGLAHLVSDPRAGSACKRQLLWLRWMVRPADGVDLGLWPLSPSVLLIPVDTHVHRIGKNLGLTTRNDASWRTAEEITAALRRFDPEDPVKYDFAICHLGVSRECPSRRDDEKCARCVLREVCVQWRGGARQRKKAASF